MVYGRRGTSVDEACFLGDDTPVSGFVKARILRGQGKVHQEAYKYLDEHLGGCSQNHGTGCVS